MTGTDELAGRLEKIRHCIGQKCGPERSEAAAALRTLQAERNEARATTAVVRAIKDQAFEKLDAAEATIAKQAQEIAEMREALRELIGLIGRVMAPGYDNIALQEARSLSNTKGSEDDR